MTLQFFLLSCLFIFIILAAPIDPFSLKGKPLPYLINVTLRFSSMAALWQFLKVAKAEYCEITYSGCELTIFLSEEELELATTLMKATLLAIKPQ